MDRIKAFFIGVKKEIERVRWADKKSMLKFSIATIVSIMFFSLFFYVIDIVIALIKTGLS